MDVKIKFQMTENVLYFRIQIKQQVSKSFQYRILYKYMQKLSLWSFDWIKIQYNFHNSVDAFHFKETLNILKKLINSFLAL